MNTEQCLMNTEEVDDKKMFLVTLNLHLHHLCIFRIPCLHFLNVYRGAVFSMNTRTRFAGSQEEPDSIGQPHPFPE